MRSLKSNENIHKKEGGSYYVVSANKAVSQPLLTGVVSLVLITDGKNVILTKFYKTKNGIINVPLPPPRAVTAL